MVVNPNKLSQLWQELKRRRVIHVTVVYATAAFAILEAVDIIFPRVNLPERAITFLMILLAIGFPLALILALIFDLTPDGDWHLFNHGDSYLVMHYESINTN